MGLQFNAPLSQAIKESKLKARKCSEFLQPFKQRPQTSASLARRLVTQSLGLRDRITPEQRAAERKKLNEAKGAQYRSGNLSEWSEQERELWALQPMGPMDEHLYQCCINLTVNCHQMNGLVKNRRKKGRKCWTLETLPTDILYIIFSYCDVKSLVSLSCCSQKLFQIVANDSYVWLNKSLWSLVTNQTSHHMICRSSRLLTPREKCLTSENWRDGVYSERTVVRHKCRFMPWICLQKDFLWFTKGNLIHRYKRNPKSGSVYKHLLKVYKTGEDICRFVVNDDFVVSGGWKGSIAVWRKSCDKPVMSRNQLHSNDINSIDISKNKLITGSKDKLVKICSLFNDNVNADSVLRVDKIIEVNDRVLNVAIDELGTSFIVGSAGCGPLQPLLLYDIQSGQLLSQFGTNHRRGAGVLHGFWESNDEVLSCGYDSFVRLWDKRSPHKCVLSMEDPHDSAVYCISSDHFRTVMSGTARYGLTRLWDKRKPTECTQIYYVGTNNSPVYSMSFDALVACVALESSINLLSFY
ncbi:unnamed protein product [Oppiella nova]|uniref:F-box domain-containing protein n=1 Tax=Oppiella nova TaxID=334625 RepID=A0A7R9LJL5_9ACAR|nr:unnamed protein product [Oppiella nova]CAG2164197.1 unnamed protein product [Oppiella nova]